MPEVRLYILSVININNRLLLFISSNQVYNKHYKTFMILSITKKLGQVWNQLNYITTIDQILFWIIYSVLKWIEEELDATWIQHFLSSIFFCHGSRNIYIAGLHCLQWYVSMWCCSNHEAYEFSLGLRQCMSI